MPVSGRSPGGITEKATIAVARLHATIRAGRNTLGRSKLVTFSVRYRLLLRASFEHVEICRIDVCKGLFDEDLCGR